MVKRFIKYYKPHIRLFLVDMLCALLVALIDLVFPIITKKALNEIIPENNLKLLLIIGLVLLTIYVFRFILNYIIGYYGHLMGIRLETDMRRDLFHKFQNLDYQYFDDKKTGELLSNLTSHLHDVSEMSHHAPEDIFISLLMFVGSFVYLLLTCNIYLTLIVFVFLTMGIKREIPKVMRIRRGG